MIRTRVSSVALRAAIVAMLATSHGLGAQSPLSESEAIGGGAAPRLAPTLHPPLPDVPSRYWLLPEVKASRASATVTEPAVSRFSRGATLIADQQYTAGLPLVTAADLSGTPLAPYDRYYTALALAGLGRSDEADAILTALIASKPAGYLKEASRLQAADIAIAKANPRRAIELLEPLNDDKRNAPEVIWLKLGRAYELAGQTEKALDAYRTVYYDFPLSTEAGDAQSGIERLQTISTIPPDRFTRELGRAERIFTARRWAQARAAFEPLVSAATTADDRELLSLRVAECDYYLDRAIAARDGVRPFLEGGTRKAEARFFYLTAVRAAGDIEAYVPLARAMVTDFPDSSWTEETLNNLATHYVQENDDAAADAVFRQMLTAFPRGKYGERAAWKVGWLAYKTGRLAEAASTFEAAAAVYPRGDMRPAWLYWSGRARDQLNDSITANSRYRLASTDYLNSYYGRLSSRVLAARQEPPVQDSVSTERSGPAPLMPTDALVRQLVGANLYADALRELQYAQRVFGDSPAVQATIAWIRHEQGLDQRSWDRFQSLRGAINMMKRAYPQYLAAGGESLPPEVLRVMFPLDYWPLIKKYSNEHGLDPYLMAALIAQESTFTADVRSAANAYGLMQLVPTAGRQYARKVGLRYSPSLLSQPEPNIQMGMAYFKDLSERFGGDHYALASYNAGPQRVARWISERPGAAQDEFIDDIPFPETQNYVKRILGTTEDYRRLYGGGLLEPIAHSSLTAAASSAPTRTLTPAKKKAASKKSAHKTPRRRRSR